MEQLTPAPQQKQFDIDKPIADPEKIQRNVDSMLGRQLSQIIGLQAALELAYEEIERLNGVVRDLAQEESAEAPVAQGGLPPKRTP